MQVLYGFHAVEEAIRSGNRRLETVLIVPSRAGARRSDGRAEALAETCRAAGIPVRREPADRMTRLVGNDAHQGVAAIVAERGYLSLEDVSRKREGQLFLVALDGIEDPHNLGALLRTADGAGVDGVIVPERRSAPVNATVVKVSAGAAEHVRIARVTNLVRALEQLKRENVWCVGLDERGTVEYDRFDFRCDCVLVLGGEGAGLHHLVRQTCDHLLRIPMAGGVSSLNVSVAGAVVMYEAARQRRTATVRSLPREKSRHPVRGLGT